MKLVRHHYYTIDTIIMGIVRINDALLSSQIWMTSHLVDNYYIIYLHKTGIKCVELKESGSCRCMLICNHSVNRNHIGIFCHYMIMRLTDVRAELDVIFFM